MNRLSQRRWTMLVGPLLVLFTGCYSSGDYDLTPDDINALLSLESTTGATRLSADGFSTLRLVASLLQESDETRRTIVFTTTEGSFDATEDLKEKEVEADANGQAFVDLRSSEKLGSAQVQAEVKAVPGLLQQLRIDFVQPNSSDILQFVNAPRSAKADGISTSIFTVRLSSALPADKRMVTFKTTAGTFVTSGAAEEMVDASTSELATVQLKSPLEPGSAVVSASAAKATVETRIEFTAADPDSIIRFIRTVATAPADGATRSNFTVRISSDLPPGTMVTFSTTGGTFAVSAGPMEMVASNSSNQATAQLVSPLAISTASVTAAANNVSRVTNISFVRALPDKAVQVTADPIELVMDPTQAGPQSSVVVKLVRNVGTPTPGASVTLRAVGVNNQVVGFFSNVTVSDNQGQITATYVPGSTTYRGEVSIRATADGTSLVGSTIVRLVDPPPS